MRVLSAKPRLILLAESVEGLRGTDTVRRRGSVMACRRVSPFPFIVRWGAKTEATPVFGTQASGVTEFLYSKILARRLRPKHLERGG